MTSYLLPNGKQQFIDINGNPLVAGTVGMYVPNSLIFKDTWQDSGETILNTNPIVLDSRGQAIIYGSGLYRQIVKDATGNLIWDQLTSSPPTSLTGDVLTPEMFGSNVGMGGDDSPAFALWALAVTAGKIGLAQGTYHLSQTITFANDNAVIWITGTIRPYSNPVSQQPFFSITGNNVTFDGCGSGIIDGISSAYSNWDAFYVLGPPAAALGVSGFLNKPIVTRFSFTNLGVQNTNAVTIQFAATHNAEFTFCQASNCGKTDAFVNTSGPFFFHGKYNRDLLIDTVYGDTIGNTFINNSASLNTIIRNCSGSNCTLFAYKGGYGTALEVTNDVAPTTTTFSVANNNYAKAQLSLGMGFFNISASSFPLPEGYVLSQVDHGSYLTITTFSAMSAAPVAGDAIMPTETGTFYDRIRYYLTGLDGMDLNNSWDITVSNPYIRGAGLLKISGSYYGISPDVCSGIWVGADAISGNSNIRTKNITITGADIADCYGSGIQVDGACANVVIDGYHIENIGVGTDLSVNVTPTSWGISTNKFSTNLANSVTIGAGTINTMRGGGIYSAFSFSDSLHNAVINAPVGIEIFAQTFQVINDNIITATATLTDTFGFLVATGGPPNNSILFSNNLVLLSAASFDSGAGTGYGINVDDASASAIWVQPGNRLISNASGGSPGFTTVGGAGVGGVDYTNQTLP